MAFSNGIRPGDAYSMSGSVSQRDYDVYMRQRIEMEKIAHAEQVARQYMNGGGLAVSATNPYEQLAPQKISEKPSPKAKIGNKLLLLL